MTFFQSKKFTTKFTTKITTLILGFLFLFLGFWGLSQTNLNYSLTSFTINPFGQPKDTIIINSERLELAKKLPIAQDYQPFSANANYEFEFDWNNTKQSKINLSTNSCAELVFVNDQELYNKSEITFKNQELNTGKKSKLNSNLCSNPQNILLDISSQTQNGKNKIKITTSDSENKTLNLVGSFWDIKFLVPYLLILIGSILILIAIARWLNFGWQYITIFIGGLIVRFGYFYNTTPYFREDDALGHIDYIKILSQNQSIPLPDYCWQCYHQPFYHTVIVILKDTWINFGLESIAKWEVMTQGFSLLLSLIVMIVAGLIFRIIDSKISWKDKLSRLLSQFLPVAMFTFWSANVQGSIKINNDIFVHLFSVLGIYFVTKWWFDMKEKNLMIASLFGCLATLSKTSGFAVMMIVGFLFGLKFLSTNNFKPTNILRLINKYIVSISLIVFFVLCSGFLIGYRSSLASGDNKLVPNAQYIDNKFILNNSFSELFYVNLDVYFNRILSNYTSVNTPITIGQILKSTILVLDQSLWITNTLNTNTLQVLYLMVFILFVLSLFYIFVSKNNQFDFLYWIFILYLCNLMIARVASPVLPTVNIRYIQPILIPMSILPILVVQSWNNRIKYTFLVLFWVFVIANILLNLSFFINNSPIL